MTYKILLVEKADDDPWLIILKDKINNALQEMGHPNATITIKTNFRDAFAALREPENHWDLLVTDVSLGTPQKLGIQLMDYASREMLVPTIAISGSPEVTTQNVCYLLIDLKASYFIAKQSFNGKKFKEKVKELLQDKSPPIQVDNALNEQVSIYGLGTEDREYLLNTLARLATSNPSGAKNYFRDVVRRLSLPPSWEGKISDVWTGGTNEDARILINWLEQRKDYPKSFSKQDYTILGAMVENLLEDSGDSNLLEIIQNYKLITHKEKLEKLKHQYGA